MRTGGLSWWLLSVADRSAAAVEVGQHLKEVLNRSTCIYLTVDILKHRDTISN